MPLGPDMALVRKARWKTGKQQTWKWQPKACLKLSVKCENIFSWKTETQAGSVQPVVLPGQLLSHEPPVAD